MSLQPFHPGMAACSVWSSSKCPVWTMHREPIARETRQFPNGPLINIKIFRPTRASKHQLIMAGRDSDASVRISI